jgi:tRNA A37 threonylcarbamoyladenosine dehydratase
MPPLVADSGEEPGGLIYEREEAQACDFDPKSRLTNPPRSDEKVPVESLEPTPDSFQRLTLLVGEKGTETLQNSHVMVLGLGGVGSWAAEALARCGVGRLSLVDFDRVCSSNINRQLPALQSTLGRPKCQVMAERLAQVDPRIRVEGLERAYSSQASAELLNKSPDFVLDAIDQITAKCHLLATCRQRGIPVVTSTGAAGRMDPTRLRVADLARTRVDPLALAVRKILRVKYGFHPKKAFGIPAVFSEEEPVFPCSPGDEGSQESALLPELEEERKQVVYGTACFVTGVFGLMAASLVVRGLLEGKAPSSARQESGPDRSAS